MARLPTFIIAGAMRSGTTSLNGYLREHPDVAVSQPKEVHFFDHNFDRGIDWYLEHFGAVRGEMAVGEATPDYLYHPAAMERIAATIPDVKLLVLLRNPVERAYSHYWHNRSRGRETLEFSRAVAAEPERISTDERSRAFFSYVDRGRYREQIDRVYDWFPRDRILIQTFEDLSHRPDAVYARSCRFIGVDDRFCPENLGRHINAYVEFRSTGLRNVSKRFAPSLRRIVGKMNEKPAERYPPMDPSVRAHLTAVFEEANAGLVELTGVPAASWS